MTLEELKEKLKAIIDRQSNRDTERDHIEADGLLLEYINDEEVTRLFEEIEKWYD